MHCNKTKPRKLATRMYKQFQTKFTVPVILKFLLCILFLLYIAFRLNIDITYDEHFTLNSFVSSSFQDIVLCTPCDANHHILNTILVKCFTLIFGESIWIARLPNFFFAILYAFASIKISNRFSSPLLSIFTIFVLLFNPFLIQFFALARGYGISLALLLFSLHYLMRYWHHAKTKHLLLALISAGLAAYSNFSSLHFTAAVFFLVPFKWIINRKIDHKLHPIHFLIILTIFTALLLPPIVHLIEQGHLYYGGKDGFIQNTLLSLTAYSTGFAFNAGKAWPILISILLIYGTLIIIRFKTSESITKNKFMHVIPHLILMLCLVSIIAQHYILGTLWLLDRTALFLYPLFVVSLSVLLQNFLVWKTIPAKIFIFFILLVFTVNFSLQFNLYKTTEWQHDSRSSEVLKLLAERTQSEGKQIFLDTSWPIQRSIEYYAQSLMDSKVKVLDLYHSRDSIHQKATHYLFYDRNLPNVGYWQSAQAFENRITDTLLVYPNERLYLFELKSKN